MDTIGERPYDMKYCIFILFFNLALAQNNKYKVELSKLKDPEPRWPKIISPLTVDSQLVHQGARDLEQIIIEGFRVQVMASGNRSKAENLKKDLSLNYSEAIYVVFEAPNYKVRIGNFIDRKKAEAFRRSLVNNGYPSAWIIRTRIEPKVE